MTQSYPPGVVRGLRSGAGLRGRSFISTGGSSGLCIDGARRLEVVSSHEWSQAQRGADRSPCFSVSGGTRAMSANGSIGVLLLPLLFGPCGWRSMRKAQGRIRCINGGTQTTSIWRSEGDVARED